MCACVYVCRGRIALPLPNISVQLSHLYWVWIYPSVSEGSFYIITRHTHIHIAHSTRTQTTDLLASILFTSHCKAHSHFFDWQVIWSNQCCDCLRRTSLRIALLSSSSGSALRGWNITPLVVHSHYKNGKTTEKLLERWALWSNCHSREKRALSPKVGKVSLRLPFQAKACVCKCVCALYVSGHAEWKQPCKSNGAMCSGGCLLNGLKCQRLWFHLSSTFCH